MWMKQLGLVEVDEKAIETELVEWTILSKFDKQSKVK